jgi:hypothetical protein
MIEGIVKIVGGREKKLQHGYPWVQRGENAHAFRAYCERVDDSDCVRVGSTALYLSGLSPCEWSPREW